MPFNRITRGTCVALVLTLGFAVGSPHGTAFAQNTQPSGTISVAVGPQYDTTHVYVAPEDFDRFVASLVATFGGTISKQGVFTVTPTPSSTMSQLVLTPVGTISVFGFKTPIPYPFGLERTGYLVTDLDAAIRAARSTGAHVLVAPFNDPIGGNAIIQWPGGVNTQLYWRTAEPSYGHLSNDSHASNEDSQCAVIDISDPLKPTSVAVVHGVKQQLEGMRSPELCHARPSARESDPCLHQVSVPDSVFGRLGASSALCIARARGFG